MIVLTNGGVHHPCSLLSSICILYIYTVFTLVLYMNRDWQLTLSPKSELYIRFLDFFLLYRCFLFVVDALWWRKKGCSFFSLWIANSILVRCSSLLIFSFMFCFENSLIERKKGQKLSFFGMLHMALLMPDRLFKNYLRFIYILHTKKKRHISKF